MKLLDKIEKVNDVFRKEEKLDHRYDWEKSILISFHCDWYKAPSGHYAYYNQDHKKRSKGLAMDVLEETSKLTGLIIRKIVPDTVSRFGRIGIIRDTMPMNSFLFEVSDLEDRDKMLDKNWQRLFWEGVINGLKKFKV